MAVKAWLEGHPFDLEDLANLLMTGDLRVVHDTDDHGYYLTAPEIDNPPDTNRFDIPAERLILRVNGLGRAQSADFRPVKLNGKYTTPDGKNHHFAAANLEGRAGVAAAAVAVGPDGQPQPQPPSPWPGYLALAATHSDVAEVLEIMGRTQPLGWDDLYKVYEIVRESIRPDNILGLNWVTQTKLDSFKESANRKDISGPGARHARRPGQPRHSQMLIAEARSLVSDFVTSWLDSLTIIDDLATHPGATTSDVGQRRAIRARLGAGRAPRHPRPRYRPNGGLRLG